MILAEAALELPAGEAAVVPVVVEVLRNGCDVRSRCSLTTSLTHVWKVLVPGVVAVPVVTPEVA
jgi:hypothetical protein